MFIKKKGREWIPRDPITEVRVEPRTSPKPSNDLHEKTLSVIISGPLTTTFPSELVYINKLTCEYIMTCCVQTNIFLGRSVLCLKPISSPVLRVNDLPKCGVIEVVPNKPSDKKHSSPAVVPNDNAKCLR